MFLIVWLFFYADKYSLAQNIAVVLASVIAGIGILAAAWATWGIRYASRHQEIHMEKPMGMMIVNIVAGVGWLIFLVIWLFFYAGDFNGYQNLAVFIFSVMVWGAIAGSAWAARWMRMRRRARSPPSPPQMMMPPPG